MSDVPSRSIGVVIRTLDESALIGRCLDTLRAQNGCFHLDMVVVDSGSRDGTVEIARSHGARVLELSPAEFDYSKALNLGIEHVRGELIVSLSAHAIPVDEHVLERISAPFRDPTRRGSLGAAAAVAGRPVAGGQPPPAPVRENATGLLGGARTDPLQQRGLVHSASYVVGGALHASGGRGS